MVIDALTDDLLAQQIFLAQNLAEAGDLAGMEAAIDAANRTSGLLGRGEIPGIFELYRKCFGAEIDKAYSLARNVSFA